MQNDTTTKARKSPYTIQAMHLHNAKHICELVFRDFFKEVRMNVPKFRWDLSLKKSITNDRERKVFVANQGEQYDKQKHKIIVPYEQYKDDAPVRMLPNELVSYFMSNEKNRIAFHIIDVYESDADY